jgi:hypothetical protein
VIVGPAVSVTSAQQLPQLNRREPLESDANITGRILKQELEQQQEKKSSGASNEQQREVSQVPRCISQYKPNYSEGFQLKAL